MADRWRVAVHEGGHVVAARLMGLPVGGASAVPSDAYAYVPFDGGSWASVCMLMGGAIGEALVFGGYDEHGASWDWEIATELMDGMGVDDGGEALWRWTFALMLVRLATELFHVQVLDGDAIDALLAQ